MAITVRVQVQSNRLASMAAGLVGKRRAIVRAKAERVAARARGTVPVLTGELRDSIGVTEQGDDAFVEATAEHAVYVHYGTSRMAPRPFLAQAAEEERSSFVDDLKALFR